MDTLPCDTNTYLKFNHDSSLPNRLRNKNSRSYHERDGTRCLQDSVNIERSTFASCQNVIVEQFPANLYEPITIEKNLILDILHVTVN